jgi:DNA-binding PadR family transcriptional regulator
MTAVFSHGRLRLYVLKLLAEGPRHGYELIRLLENRFLGLYAPSAGTIYPRLARLEAEGLVSHTASGGRKVYEITEAGRAELNHRAGELAELETEIRASVEDLSTLANEIQHEVRGSVRDIKRELRQAARETGRGGGWTAGPRPGPLPSAGGSTGQRLALDHRITEFSVELRRLVSRAPIGEDESRAISEALDTALAVIRRLLS